MVIAAKSGICKPRRKCPKYSACHQACSTPSVSRCCGVVSFDDLEDRQLVCAYACCPTTTLAGLQGTIRGHEHVYQLDDTHKFVTGAATPVSGNTAAMVGEEGVSWLSKHFQVNAGKVIGRCCSGRDNR